jgi:hypothetical protein
LNVGAASSWSRKKEMHLAMVEDAKGILAKGEDEA